MTEREKRHKGGGKDLQEGVKGRTTSGKQRILLTNIYF
jgi:hypothetical protein